MTTLKIGTAPRCFIGMVAPLQALPAHHVAARLLSPTSAQTAFVIVSDALRHRQLLGLLGHSLNSESRSSIRARRYSLLYLLILIPLLRSARCSQSCVGLDVWDLTAPVERLKGREPQVSTRTPLLSLSNSPTRRPIHQAKSKVQGR
jgi:hypothetical protein